LNPDKALRAGTAEAQGRLDNAFAAFDLTDRDDYAAFLRAHAAVVLPLEDALPGERIVDDWEDRKRGALLREDLTFLRHPGESRDRVPPAAQPAAQDPCFRRDDGEWDESAIAGAIYTLESARLGGRFLVRQLPRGFPRAYLDAEHAPENWRALLETLDTILCRPEALQSALAAAHHVFAAFEQSARRWTKV
jgi:heme oxygenase